MSSMKSNAVVSDPAPPLRSQNGSQFRSQFRSQIGSQFRSQIGSQFRSQIGSQFRSQIGSQFRSQIGSQFRSRSRSRSESEIKYQKIVRQVHLDEYVPWSNDDLLPQGTSNAEFDIIENILNELMRCKQRIDECTLIESRRFKVYPELAHIVPI